MKDPEFDFRVSEALRPVEAHFNYTFDRFVKEIEKRIGFESNNGYSDNILTKYYSSGVSDKIIINLVHKITLIREDGSSRKFIDFYPHPNGTFSYTTLWNQSSEGTSKEQDLLPSAFLLDKKGSGISKLKKFLELKI